MLIEANGISMSYEIEGPADAPIVTMSHSLAANLAMWDDQMPALAGAYRVLRYDSRGHGATEAPEGGYTMELLADDLLALLDALAIDKTQFVGLSMGGMVGMTAALKDQAASEASPCATPRAECPPSRAASGTSASRRPGPRAWKRCSNRPSSAGSQSATSRAERTRLTPCGR